MTPDRPILFLDIDGVANCCSYRKAHWPGKTAPLEQWGMMLCPESMALINRITDETGAGIVVCSDWRLKGPTEILYAVMREGGITGDLLGVTPSIYERRRDIEISGWIGQTFGWDDESRLASLRFVAIDDNPQLYPTIRARVIQTSDWGKGITESHVRLAIKLLGQPIGPGLITKLMAARSVTDAW